MPQIECYVDGFGRRSTGMYFDITWRQLKWLIVSFVGFERKAERLTGSKDERTPRGI